MARASTASEGESTQVEYPPEFACADTYGHAFALCNIRTPCRGVCIAIHVCTRMIHPAVIKGRVAQGGSYYVRADAVGHFGSHNPVVFLDNIFRINIFSPDKPVGSFRSSAD